MKDRAQEGADALRETISRRDHKPGPEMPGWGSYAGPIQNPGKPRYGDPNFGDQAWEKVRNDRNQAQEQKQQQRQER